MHYPLTDPEMQALAGALAAPGVPSIASASPQDLRNLMAAMRPPPSVVLKSISDEVISRQDGSSIAVRRYVPEGQSSATILYFHGGGWTIGSIDDYDHCLRLLTRATGCTLLSVDYRLAPEHIFPAAVEDAWTVLNAVGGEAHPLIVAGDSAGGNLSAVIAQLAKAAGAPAIAAQILIYPFVNGDMGVPQLDAFVPPVLNKAEILRFVDHYVPDPAQRSDPRFSPIVTADLSGLPAAMIVTAQADLLAAQADDYAARLRQAGVTVESWCQPDGVHAYFSLAPESQAADITMRKIAAFISDICATT